MISESCPVASDIVNEMASRRTLGGFNCSVRAAQFLFDSAFCGQEIHAQFLDPVGANRGMGYYCRILVRPVEYVRWELCVTKLIN